MKYTFLFIAIIIFTNEVMAQTKGTTHEIDSLIIPEHLSLDSTQFYQIVRKQFNLVINSSGKNTIGNYASADIKDGHIAFNATKTFKNSNMLSVNANGGVTDGAFAIFNQTKINSNIGIDIKYNILLRPLSLSYDDNDEDGEIIKLQKRLDDVDTVFKYNTLICNHYLKSLNKKLDLLNIEIKTLTAQLTPQLGELEKANVDYQLALKNLQADSLRLKIYTLKPEEVRDVNKRQARKDKIAAVDAFEYTAIRFQWISLGAGLQNNSFNQFNPNQTILENQLVKQNYTVWNITAEWNQFRWDQFSNFSYYLLVGGKFIIDDNFSDLTKVELNDTYQYGNTTTQRTVSKKITAYKGDYQIKLLGGKLYVDFYKFFWGNVAAFHIYPEVNFKQYSSPLYNTGIGLLYSFQDAKDNRAKINAEFYFSLSDLSNITNTDLTVLQRNELGLRISVPVSFFNLLN